NAPDALSSAGAPATTQQIDEAETAMASQLPSELREFYAILNGADESGVFPSQDEWDDMAYGPLPLEQIVDEWTSQKELLDMGDFADRDPSSASGIANDWWNISWIPFAGNGGGDFICIDLAPASGGTCGQIITHSHESGEHVVLASSLADYLQQLADAMESGALEYDPDCGVQTPVDDE
ncbi:MAG: SMI1/KNR4 family protein, partial [Planctomycetaceae bacterium]|nr:SMI1/KNR4 family protein [Planctomycetaceae bacterium]